MKFFLADGFDVGLPGEVGEVLVNLPEPDLGANHALGAPHHRHGNWKFSLIHTERIDYKFHVHQCQAQIEI